ncbi:MAG: serine hydrolase [Myxococcales bacterium]|nr:serine hydrolase [Myxococcales bacterium]
MPDLIRIEGLIRAAIAQKVAPAIAFSVSQADEAPLLWFSGAHRPPPDAGLCDHHTRFDLASLTKPLTTTLWALQLVSAGRLDLDAPLGDALPLADAALAHAPVWRLLNHTAGLPAHRPYFRGLGAGPMQRGTFDAARAALRRMLAATECASPPGAEEVYSDLGYLLLEWLCETRDRALAERWKDLPGHGPDSLHFRALSAATATADARYAATEACPWRRRMLQGEVHDENCWVMGGIGGHAGLFGTLPAVHHLARRWLQTIRGEDAGLGLRLDLAMAATDRKWMHPRGTRVLGWDTPTPGRSSAGRHFGRNAIGHLGFTGTSIWLDPDADVVMVLLTNRVCPSRENQGIRALRPTLHDAGWACFT